MFFMRKSVLRKQELEHIFTASPYQIREGGGLRKSWRYFAREISRIRLCLFCKKVGASFAPGSGAEFTSFTGKSIETRRD
jgi:hypothetical protein